MRRVVLSCLVASACGTPIDDLADGVLILPRPLREVSGIVAVDEDTLVCVQDEVGALFFVDLRGRHPPRREVFGPPGDYEGIAFAGGDYWVLRADGVVLRVGRRDGAFAITGTSHLSADYEEWEGLALDAAGGVLLAMPKDNPKSVGDRRLRRVFAIDVTDGRSLPEPVVTIDLRALLAQAVAEGIEVPVTSSAKGKQRLDLHLACSELSVVPGSRDLLLLSSADHAVLRVDRQGRLVGFRALSPTELVQPEGLALLPDGRLLVASEGAEVGVVAVVPLP